jgi:hypothetical protein
MKPSRLRWSLLLLFGAQTVFASFGEGDRGTSSAQFLKLGAGGRALALAGASLTDVGDASAIYWNPAAMARLSDPNTALVMHSAYLSALFYDYAAYVKKLTNRSVGISVQYLSAGEIDRKDADGNSNGHFSPYDFVMTWALAQPIRRQEGAEGHWGVAVKTISSKITRQAHTVAADAGVALPLDGRERFLLAGTLHNVGPGLRYLTQTDPLPLTAKLGLTMRVLPSWNFSMAYVLPRDDKSALAFGSESLIWNRNGLRTSLRLGLNTQTAADLEGWAGFTGGIGFSLQKWTLDYAFVPYDRLGSTHYASLGIKF